MKRLVKHLILIFCIILVSLMGTYVGLAVYYHNAFAYGTWINDVYCTGKSIEEVNEELVKDFTYEGIEVSDKDGNTYMISAEQIGYQFDFLKALEIYRKQQNSWMWIESLLHGDNTKLTPVVSYDRQVLEEIMTQIPFIAEEGRHSEEDRKIAIVRTNQGYELINERIGVLQVEEAKNAITTAIEESRTEISLAEEGCYRDLKLTEQMQDTLKMWEKVERFQQCGIVYQMGDETRFRLMLRWYVTG